MEVVELTETIYFGWLYPRLLSKEQCKYYREIIDSYDKKESRYVQDIINLPDLANELWKIIKTNLPKRLKLAGCRFKLIGLSDHVTISRHSGRNIGIHKDSDVKISYKGKQTRDYVCLYKLAIYLNDLSDPNDPYDKTGGTKFYNSMKRCIHTVKPTEGGAVLFDMREWHSGTQVPKGETKYMLGLRPIYENLGRIEKSNGDSFKGSSKKSSKKSNKESSKNSIVRKRKNRKNHSRIGDEIPTKPIKTIYRSYYPQSKKCKCRKCRNPP